MASENEKLTGNYVSDDNNYTDTYDVYRRGLLQQQKVWVNEQVVPLLVERHAQSDAEITVLSVGSGEGDIDIILLHALIEEFEKKGIHDYTLHYTVVERNPVFVERFRKTLEQKGDVFAKIKFTFMVSTLEECAKKLFGNKFDFIHIIHTLYYMDAEKLMRLCVDNYLNKRGILLAVVQSEESLYAKNWRLFSQKFKHTVGDFNLLCEKEMKEIAEKIGLKFSILKGKRVIDVTDIAAGDVPNAAGYKLLDFFFHSKNLREILQGDELREIVEFFRANTSVVDGRNIARADETLLFLYN